MAQRALFSAVHSTRDNPFVFPKKKSISLFPEIDPRFCVALDNCIHVWCVASRPHVITVEDFRVGIGEKAKEGEEVTEDALEGALWWLRWCVICWETAAENEKEMDEYPFPFLSSYITQRAVNALVSAVAPCAVISTAD
jgi:hypothetical protein